MALPKMGLLIKDKNIWKQDYRDLDIGRELTEKFSLKHRGGVRIASGLFYTREECETKRREVLSKPLP